MSFGRQVVGIFTAYFLFYIHIRCFLFGIKRYQLNNSAYKKRRKSESFIDWLFYKKYKEEIPKGLRLLHHVVLIIHPACFVACLIVHITGLTLHFDIGYILVTSLIIFDVSWMLILTLLFWSPRKGRDIYERWIKKRRGQKRRKRK